MQIPHETGSWPASRVVAYALLEVFPAEVVQSKESSDPAGEDLSLSAA